MKARSTATPPNKALQRIPLCGAAGLERYSALYLELYGIFNSDFIALSLRDI